MVNPAVPIPPSYQLPLSQASFLFVTSMNHCC